MIATPRLPRRSCRLSLFGVLAAPFLGVLALPAGAEAAPIWHAQTLAYPTNLAPPGATDEIQNIAVDATGGTFRLSFEGQETGPIAGNGGAEASTVEGELNSLSAIAGAGGSVSVEKPASGALEGQYVVSFEGALQRPDTPLLTADGSSLTGGTHSVVIAPATSDAYEIDVVNIGDATSSGTTTVVDHLPPGVSTTQTPVTREGNHEWKCSEGGGQTTVTCESSLEVIPASSPDLFNRQTNIPPAPYFEAVSIPIAVSPGVTGVLTNSVTVAGGGALHPATSTTDTALGSDDSRPGVSSLSIESIGSQGAPANRAAEHPYAVITDLQLNQRRQPPNEVLNETFGNSQKDQARVVIGDLPLGLIGNPQATPRCSTRAFGENVSGGSGGAGVNESACPSDTRVGVVDLGILTGGVSQYSLYNLAPDPGHAAEFGLHTLASYPIVFYGDVVHSGGAYRLRITALVPQAHLQSLSLIFYGNPAAVFGTGGQETAFLTNPADCSASEADRTLSLHLDTWGHPGVGDPFDADFNDPNWLPGSTLYPSVDGCEELHFEPSIEARPTTNVADSPSGLNVDIKIPQNEEIDARATPELKKAVVTLPQGVSVNPSAANGLGACSEAQIELEGNGVPSCPESSKLGTVEVETPLLEEELTGQIYLARQAENPFHSLLALYLTIEDKERGVMVKLAGEVHPAPVTGQLTATFDENPQIPFEDLKLDFFGGARAPLRSPATCGPKTTTTALSPWSAPQSGPPASPTSVFATSVGANGGTCPTSAAEEPNQPGFTAGTLSPQAGASSPFSLKLTRADGSQELSSVDAVLPPGLAARLAGVPYCPDAAIAAAAAKSGVAEQQSSSCPAASEVGTVTAGAGAGPDPLYVQGHVYLAGPYKGAPLSLAIVTPAVAGPFDLGTVVVRVALFVNPETAQVTAKSDPIPTILQGIPLDVRSIALNINKPDFTVNPTSCEKMSVLGSTTSVLNQGAALTNAFQVGGCNALKFKPKLKLSLKGSTKHAGHPALKAVLTYPRGSGYANIARAQVNLPHSEFIDQGNLNKTCTKPVLLAGNCPATSIYGKAKAWTPLLEKPLEGNVYLVGGYGYKLPALVAELDGQIRVVLKGKVDSGPNHGIRNTFEAVPDAPVEKFVLEMKGGPKYSLLENSEDLCKKPQRAIARFSAQNGMVEQVKPLIANQCGKQKHEKGKKTNPRKH
jgi:hypothetical protein